MWGRPIEIWIGRNAKRTSKRLVKNYLKVKCSIKYKLHKYIGTPAIQLLQVFKSQGGGMVDTGDLKSPGC